MPTPRLPRWLPIAVATGLLALPSAAQEVTEPSLKAAFVYNLAKFTQWPADVLPSEGPFVLCVAGDARVGQALVRTAQDRMLIGRRVNVMRVALTDSTRHCHLLYATGLTLKQVEPLFAPTLGRPILTVTDVEQADRPYGIARMFVENGKLRFELDHGLAKRSRLQLSSRLLSLARRVFDSDRPQ